MFSKNLLLAILVLYLLNSSTRAEKGATETRSGRPSITVSGMERGVFDSLQAAIDAAPDGATLNLSEPVP